MKYSAAMTTLRSSQFSARNVGTLIVVFVYVVYYGALIIKGHGIPYVLDNNETYSALLHAHNLWNFDFFKSFGLADDATSPLAAAHPVIHTHQGDFPRIFAFILYALGARSAESQVWITTFTVGLASLLLAQTFFRRVGNDVFATIATLLLITDYLLFAQWQVNTYRVWHGFFFFAALTCVHGLTEWKRSKWAIATIVLYACLLYWELVYASFVAVTVGTYTLIIYRRTPRLVVVAALVQTIGAAIGLGILICQVILYLGWHDFITDLKLTYGARNFGDDPFAVMQTLKDFYDTRNITFWYNIQSDIGSHGIVAFLHSIFANVFQVQSPLFVLVTLCLSVASLVADSRLPNAQDTRVVNFSVSTFATVVLGLGFFSFLMTVALGGNFLRNTFDEDFNWLDSLSSLRTPLFVFGFGFALSILLRKFAATLTANRMLSGPDRCSVAAIYFLYLSIFIISQQFLYDVRYESLSSPVLITPWLVRIVVSLAALAGGILILSGKRSLLGSWQSVPSSLIPYFVSGVVGYLFVYVFNPGYLNSGYLVRLCPLPIFHVDAFLALGLFAAVGIATNAYRKGRLLKFDFGTGTMAAVSGALIVALLGYWALLQYRYMYLVPPTQFAFAKTLNSRPAASEGIVSNTYAAPFGMIANTWAYMDGDFGNEVRPGTRKMANRYLWFADKASNLTYQTPGLFVCFEQLATLFSIANYASLAASNAPGCSRFEAAGKGKPDGPQLKLINKDEQNHRWAVYELKWK